MSDMSSASLMKTCRTHVAVCEHLNKKGGTYENPIVVFTVVIVKFLGSGI